MNRIDDFAFLLLLRSLLLDNEHQYPSSLLIDFDAVGVLEERLTDVLDKVVVTVEFDRRVSERVAEG